METCAQCGIRAAQHPIVGIMAVKDVEAHPYAKLEQAIEVLEANGSNWAAMPVCKACHEAPALKCHFHYRANYKTGLALAGSNTIGAPPKA